MTTRLERERERVFPLCLFFLGHFHVLSNEWERLCRYVLSDFFARNYLLLSSILLLFHFSKNQNGGRPLSHFAGIERKKKHFCFQVHQNKWENKFGLLSAPPPVCYLSCEADTFRHLLSLQSRNREGHFFLSCAIELAFLFFFVKCIWITEVYLLVMYMYSLKNTVDDL